MAVVIYRCWAGWCCILSLRHAFFFLTAVAFCSPSFFSRRDGNPMCASIWNAINKTNQGKCNIEASLIAASKPRFFDEGVFHLNKRKTVAMQLPKICSSHTHSLAKLKMFTSFRWCWDFCWTSTLVFSMYDRHRNVQAKNINNYHMTTTTKTEKKID